jgi:4,5-dihydroxyphthalate decarboxylase
METLRLATGDYGINKQLKTRGRISDRATLVFTKIEAILSDVRSMARTEDYNNADYDVCEMPITTYLTAKSFGKAITAIPVFVTRNFHHWPIFCSIKAGISEPKDFEGKTVGVNRGYTVTTGLWARGMLSSEYGVDLEKVHWAATDEEHIAEFVLPPNCDYNYRGRTMGELFEEGLIVGAIGDIKGLPDDIQPLIPDAREAGFAYYRKTGIYPVNHTIVVRNAILDREPEIALDLFKAFEESKEAYVASLDSIAAPTPGDELTIALRDGVGGDPFPNGIKANTKSIDALAQFALDQHITPVKYSTEELFAKATHGT